MSAINVNNVWTNILDDQTGESVNFEEVTTWWDGTPMDDSKADGEVYRKLPASVGGGYVRRVYDNFGQLFLEKDTMAEMRALSSTEILLIQIGRYKGVKLNGYYDKGDTPAPIEYYLSDTVEEDDGGSVIEVGGIKLEHEFVGAVNVLYYGISGNDFIDYSIQYAIILQKYGGIEFNSSTTYNGDININRDDVVIIGNGCYLAGTISSSNQSISSPLSITNDVAFNNNIIQLNDIGDLEEGDYIQIADFKDHIENEAKEPPRELNKILSIEGDEVLLQNNTRHLYVSQSTVQKVIPYINVDIRNINVQSYDIFNVIQLNMSGVNAVGWSLITFAENVNIITKVINNSYSSPTVFFKGVNEGSINISAQKGKDCVKIFGCANLQATIHVKDSDNRGIWLYGCNNINSSDWSILGTREHIDANFEILIFDYSKNCIFSKGTLNEENKYSVASTGPQPIEFRMYSDTCKVVDSTIYNKGSGIIVTYKASVMNCGVENSTIHINPKATLNAIYICELVGDEAGKYPSVVQPRSSLIFTGNKVYYTGESNIMIMRSASSATFSTPYPSIDISDNEMTVPTAVRVYVASIAPQMHNNIFIRNNKFYGVSGGQTLHYIVGSALATVDNLFIKDNYLDNISTVRYTSIDDSVIINKLYVNNINDPYRKSATTSSRPTKGLTKGYNIFDETLNKPLWYDGTNWVDATGTIV